MTSQNLLFVGVGGQGILTASDIVAEIGLRVGLDAKKSEIHGFSQRGGVVESHVRWGERVGSPMSEKGTIDYLVSFELLEAARFIDYLRPGGTVIANSQKLIPMSVSGGNFEYPSLDDIKRSVGSRTDKLILIDALGIAQMLGNTRLVNTIILGALATFMDIDSDIWLSVIEGRVPPKYATLNRKAFMAGQQAIV